MGPWSLGELSQILAQSRISPALAQIILSIDPLISVLFAGFISAAEQQLGLKGWAGCILLIVACIIAGEQKFLASCHASHANCSLNDVGT